MLNQNHHQIILHIHVQSFSLNVDLHIFKAIQPEVKVTKHFVVLTVTT